MEHQLQLKRPLAFFDLETTGIMVNRDRIVEISIAKANVDGRVYGCLVREYCCYSDWIYKNHKHQSLIYEQI